VALVRCTEAYLPTHQQAIETVLAAAAVHPVAAAAAAVAVKGRWKEGNLVHQAHPVVAVVVVKGLWRPQDRPQRERREKEPLNNSEI
jgi:hypothetical protein